MSENICEKRVASGISGDAQSTLPPSEMACLAICSPSVVPPHEPSTARCIEEPSKFACHNFMGKPQSKLIIEGTSCSSSSSSRLSPRSKSSKSPPESSFSSDRLEIAFLDLESLADRSWWASNFLVASL